MNKNQSRILNTTVVVSALGYFVDIYDLILFSIVRVVSLKDLGVTPERMLDVGVSLLNAQMLGMLLGGIVWGVLGDKWGRLSVLFGSIFLYSIANILNGFVHDVESYWWLRFFAGVGLAGELGAAITLVTEVMSKETRGMGTMVVTTVGVTGAIVGGWVADLFHWRISYFIGGGLGLVLLVLRMKMFESGMYERASKSSTRRGTFGMLFSERTRFIKYLSCILMGVPTWFVIGILLTFAPELALGAGIVDPIKTSRAIMFGYIGFTLGDFASGYLSQLLRSRKKVILAFLVFTWLSTVLYLYWGGGSALGFYMMCLLVGTGGGYWALFVTNAAEQFGTNIRSTVSTTVPNLVRGSTVAMTALFKWGKSEFGIIHGTFMLSILVCAIALVALMHLPETFAKELDYLE